MTSAESWPDAAESGDGVAVSDGVAEADDLGATARTQRAKPLMSPSGFVLRYSSHLDNKGMTEEAVRPIRTILI